MKTPGFGRLDVAFGDELAYFPQLEALIEGRGTVSCGKCVQ